MGIEPTQQFLVSESSVGVSTGEHYGFYHSLNRNSLKEIKNRVVRRI